MSGIPIQIAVEDELSEAVTRKLLESLNRDFLIGDVYSRGGFGYLKKNISAFNNAAKGVPYLVVTDLDRAICPLDLIEEWLPSNRHENLIFRIAVREIES